MMGTREVKRDTVFRLQANLLSIHAALQGGGPMK